MKTGMIEPFPIFLTGKEAAGLVRLSPKYLLKLATTKKGPPVYKIGSRLRFKKSDLLRWIDDNRKR